MKRRLHPAQAVPDANRRELPYGLARLDLASSVVPLALVAAACAAREPSQRAPRRAPLLAEASLQSAYETPAWFRYHPREQARIRAELPLGDRKRLLVGDRGERWLFDADARTLTPGAMLAPEPLIAILGDAAAFSFVGASGTSYVSRGPLGPFERSSAPVEALNGVSAAGTSIVGVRQARSLLRSGDFGVTWAPVGPDGVALIDVAFEPFGHGLALATPEAVYETADAGETWHKSELPTIGALELASASDRSIHALTPLGEYRWDPQAPKSWSPARVGVPVKNDLPPPPRGPDAFALAEGRAALTSAAYFELVAAAERGAWDLLLGPLNGNLRRIAVPEAKGCRLLRLAAFERYLLFACFRESAETLSQPIELYESDSHGEHFARLPGKLSGVLSSFRLAVGADGRWLASGVCSPGNVGAGCAPSGIQRQRRADDPEPRGRGPAPAAAAAPGILSATPSLSEVALALAYSADGQSAYAVGRRTKTGRFALFVSQDQGKSFEPEDLDLGQVASADSEDDMVERSPGTRVESLSFTEDGAAAISFVHYGRRTLVVTDDHGKLLSSVEPPEERALLAAAGLRAVSIAPKSRQLWESLDGGVTWNPAAPLPLELCPADESCEVPVRCGQRGCVIGRELSRIGWAGQTAEDSALLPPPLRPLRAPAARRVSTPIACTLDSAPFIPLYGVKEAPGAHEASLGNVAWFAVGEEASRAAVTVYHAKKGRVEPTPLLAAVPRPEQFAYAVQAQVEGVAAIRYQLPDAQSGQTSLSDVEVAWDNLVEGRLGRARLPDGGPYVPGDYVTTGARSQHAQPDLVSIASGGIYLRLHKSTGSDQPTLFLDGRRVEVLETPRWAVDPRYPARSEVVHLGSAHVPLLFVGRGAALARARLSGRAWQFEAVATGMIDPASFGLVELDTIAYVGQTAGLYVEVQDGTGALAEAHIFPLRADGPVVDAKVNVPTQRALGERPEACDSERKARTPRVVAAFQSGTRHPVIVTDSVEGPRTLLTGFAVLYGAPESACVAAFEASGVGPETSQSRDTALILNDDPEHSVLFRRVGERVPHIEYKTMSCRFDPALEVPPEVYRAIK